MVSSWWCGIVCGNIFRGSWSLRGLAGGERSQCGLRIMNTGSSSIWRGRGVPGRECHLVSPTAEAASLSCGLLGVWWWWRAGVGCYNPPTNFSFFPSSGAPSTQPAVPPPQPISTAPAPAPAPPAQPASSSQPAPLAFNPFRTDHLPLYDVTDFYEPPQGYAQLQQPLGSPHRQPLPPSDAEMSSPTHADSSIDHYGLLQPPSPRDEDRKSVV